MSNKSTFELISKHKKSVGDLNTKLYEQRRELDKLIDEQQDVETLLNDLEDTINQLGSLGVEVVIKSVSEASNA